MSSRPQAYIAINLTTQRIFLTIAYSEGVYAQYVYHLRVTGDTISRNIDEPFLLCTELSQNQQIILKLQNGNMQALLDDYGYPQSVLDNRRWTVDMMTGLEINEFMAQIIANPDECIELPSYPDLIEMGYKF